MGYVMYIMIRKLIWLRRAPESTPYDLYLRGLMYVSEPFKLYNLLWDFKAWNLGYIVLSLIISFPSINLEPLQSPFRIIYDLSVMQCSNVQRLKHMEVVQRSPPVQFVIVENWNFWNKIWSTMITWECLGFLL